MATEQLIKLGEEALSEVFPHHGHAGRDFVNFGKTQTFKPLPTQRVNGVRRKQPRGAVSRAPVVPLGV